MVYNIQGWNKMIYRISGLQINVELIKKWSDITSEKFITRTSPNEAGYPGYIHMMTLSVLGLLNEYKTWFLFKQKL